MLTEVKHRLRARSEYGLRLAAMQEVGRRYQGHGAASALPQVGVFWRYLFVPLFRRVPWSTKRKAMRALKMTARDWPEEARRFGEPWRPPPGAEQLAPGRGVESPGEGGAAVPSERPREARNAER